MKLNHDCVRDLMILAEESLDMSNYIRCSKVEMKPYSTDEIIYAACKLQEVGLIDANITKFMNGGRDVTISDITWTGHEFLDNIRDDKVWKQTKGVVSTLTSVSLNMISNIASQVLTNIINKQMGL